MSNLDIEYDVAIVGGGPIGLSAAYELATQRGKRVLVLEQSNLDNQWGSSPGFGRQWRVPYSQEWLCRLAVQASSAWNDLMSQTGRTLVDRTGVLWYGIPDRVSAEGEISSAKQVMEDLKQEFSYLNAEQLKDRFPWLTGITDKTEALFAPDGGTIDIQATINAFFDALTFSKRAVILTNTKVTRVDTHGEGVVLTTNSPWNKTFRAKKLIITPGVYVNEVLDTFSPAYPERLSLTIYLWTSVYYRLAIPNSEVVAINNRLPRPSSDKWPIWIYFGPVKTDTPEGEPVNGNSFYGFPSDVRDAPFEARVCPGFTSLPSFDYADYPPKIEDRRPDVDAINFTEQFVSEWFNTTLNSTENDKITTCVAGFATRPDGKNDEGQGFVLDILPHTHDKVVLCTGGWAMKFVPLFGRILADLALDGAAPNYAINEMKWDRGITKPPAEYENRLSRGIHVSHQHKFRHLRQILTGYAPKCHEE